MKVHETQVIRLEDGFAGRQRYVAQVPGGYVGRVGIGEPLRVVPVTFAYVFDTHEEAAQAAQEVQQ